MRGATFSCLFLFPACPFQSTLPMRGATIRLDKNDTICSIISIHTPHAGSDSGGSIFLHTLIISIHTPHAGSDRGATSRILSCVNFNPHSPCGERRFPVLHPISNGIFQSTLPMRGATYCIRRKNKRISNFNPHSPCGERHGVRAAAVRFGYFNPHSPCGERRAITQWQHTQTVFQSTLPMRGATILYKLWHRSR